MVVWHGLLVLGEDHGKSSTIHFLDKNRSLLPSLQLHFEDRCEDIKTWYDGRLALKFESDVRLISRPKGEQQESGDNVNQ